MLVLASTSPYRRELLQRLRLPFESVRPEVDEAALPGEEVAPLVRRLSAAKAAAVAAAARFQERAERDEAQNSAARNANDIENKVAADAAYRQRVRDAFKADP